MGAVPMNIRQHLAQVLAPGILSTISSVRTRFVDQKDEHSGTALLLSDEQGDTFCFTANHVVTPETRTKPRIERVVQHSYFENQFDVKNLGSVGTGQSMSPIRLRNKFLKSEHCDLAMLESCLNGFKTSDDFRKNYFNYDLLNQARFTEIFLDDVFVICGLPSKFTLPIPATGETNHQLLVHFFSGSEGAEHIHDRTRYLLKYSGDDNPSPSGMSGSPVWLVRETSSPAKALNCNRIRVSIDEGVPLNLQITFAGLVVSHDHPNELIQAVRPEVCAEFAQAAQIALPKLRDPLEDKLIAEELAWLREQCPSKRKSNI